MSRSRVRPRLAALPMTAVALSLLASAAQAGPADLVHEVLDGPEFGPFVAYESVADTGDGGVEIHGLSLTRDALVALGAIGELDVWRQPEPPAEPQPAVLSFETVRLNDGAIAALFGVQDGVMPDSVSVGLDGFTIDLAALADEAGPAMIRQYLGGLDTLAGRAEIVVGGAQPVYDMDITVDLAGVGRFALDLTIDESNGPPSGSVTVTDTAGRGMTGLMAAFQRMPVEMSLSLARGTLQDMRDHPAYNPDAEDPIFDVLEAEVAAAEALLANFPEDGPSAAAAMRVWAVAMATAMPQHAALFEAIEAYATTSGTLRLHFAPPERSDIPLEAAFEIKLYTDIEALETIIPALGMSAEFEPAG